MLKGLGSLQTGTHVNRSLSKTPIVLKRKEYACFSVLSFFCALVSNSGSLLLFALLEIHRWANPSPITTKPPWKKILARHLENPRNPRKAPLSNTENVMRHSHKIFSPKNRMSWDSSHKKTENIWAENQNILFVLKISTRAGVF